MFYLMTHSVKNYSVTGNPLLPLQGLLFLITIYNDLTCTFRASCYSTFVVGTSSDLDQRVCPRQILLLFFLITARVLLYVPSHRQDSTYHSVCYISLVARAGMRNSLMVHYEGSIR